MVATKPPHETDKSVDNLGSDAAQGTTHKASGLNLSRSLGGLGPCLTYDDAPFNLFGNQSFETYDPFTFSSPARERSFASNPSATTESDVAFPVRKQDTDDSDYSLGDISPIQLLHGSSCTDHKNASADEHQWYSDRFHSPELATSRVSNPFYVIRSCRKAFENCKYLLSATRDDDMNLCQVHVSPLGHVRHYKQDVASLLFDWSLATRRVETAVITFGGQVATSRKIDHRLSIFRLKQNSSYRHIYEGRLPHRYHISGSKVSWDMEEDPPIYMEQKDDQAKSLSVLEGQQEDDVSPSGSVVQDLSDNSSMKGRFAKEDQEELPKLKYRCKLCGQLKQNHDCPFRQCLHRSIGVMVYPAVNAFTAAEPGHIAPPLTTMNNFVSYDSDQGSPRPVNTSHSSFVAQSSPGLMPEQPLCQPNQVSPESRAPNNNFLNSPLSSLSNPSDEAMASIVSNGYRHKRSHSGNELVRSADPTHPAVFVNSVKLRPEQYRAVAPLENETALYQYPPIPITFAERKRLADTLFHLSNEIPQFSLDIANLLHVARQKDEWDLAVAELLAQVVVAMYCSEGDFTLEGLRQYLLGLGIAC